MKILSFDTCFNKTYITYKNNGEITEYSVIESNENNYHSAYLITGIKNILKNNNIKIKDLDAIGVNIGPGSFTGIRAGITIARILAQQANIKAVGIKSSEILSKLNVTAKPCRVITDARKNKVYFSEYKDGKALIEPILKEKEDIISVNNSEYFIITDSSISDYMKQHGIITLNYEAADNNLGIYAAEITEEKLKTGNKYNWADLKPVYIQPPSITKKKE